MCSGNWQRCQDAVESVLKGSTIMQVPINNDDNNNNNNDLVMPFRGCDIRHVSKNTSNQEVKTRNGRFKRKATLDATEEAEYMTLNEPPLKFSITGWDRYESMKNELKRSTSHDSFSVETVEPSLLANRIDLGQPGLPVKLEEDGDVGLELTLGFMSQV